MDAYGFLTDSFKKYPASHGSFITHLLYKRDI